LSLTAAKFSGFVSKKSFSNRTTFISTGIFSTSFSILVFYHKKQPKVLGRELKNIFSLQVN